MGSQWPQGLWGRKGQGSRLRSWRCGLPLAIRCSFLQGRGKAAVGQLTRKPRWSVFSALQLWVALQTGCKWPCLHSSPADRAGSPRQGTGSRDSVHTPESLLLDSHPVRGVGQPELQVGAGREHVGMTKRLSSTENWKAAERPVPFPTRGHRPGCWPTPACRKSWRTPVQSCRQLSQGCLP